MTSDAESYENPPNTRKLEKIDFFPEITNKTEPPHIPRHHIIISLLDELAVILAVVVLLFYYFKYLS